ncbi:MAG: CotH kinase family protein [Peptococcaceae bacterium]|nr:CotH kinase family protein [Peptococcaceae bacterium]
MKLQHKLKNKQKNKSKKWVIGVMCIGLLAFAGCTQNDTQQHPNTEPNSTTQQSVAQPNAAAAQLPCFTYDDGGRVIQGYYAPQDGVNYLFVPSTQAMGDVVIHIGDADISGASAGVLDAQSGTVAGAFAHSGDTVALTGADGTVYTVAAMQSTLPSVYIDLQDTTLADIHADKDTKHKGNSIYISTLDGAYDLAVEDSVEIKGRGNSTWAGYEKKPYQIKFDDKTSVLGMGEAKKWILLANAGDDTMMRNQLVYRAAAQMDMPYVTQFEYVDLWIEGDYRGTFLLGEKVELGSSRLDLQQDTGALFEQDIFFYEEEDYWLRSDVLGTEFVLKEIVEEEEETIAIAMEDFHTSLDTLMTHMYNSVPADVTLPQLSAMLDVDSLIKYYLINNYVLNAEALDTSCYLYKDGADDVIHFGPIWDFDTCLGNNNLPYTQDAGFNRGFFQTFLLVPEVYARTEALLTQYQPVLHAMADDVAVLQAQIADSAAMNYVRWDTLNGLNAKNDYYMYPTFDEAVDALQAWLAGRAEVFALPEHHEPVYGIYRSIKGEVLYTANEDEYHALLADSGKDYGIAWYAPTGGQPVYRLSGGLARLHYYTMDAAERDARIADGWADEGIAWYTWADGVPVYRMYKHTLLGDKYQYVADQAEIDALIAKGWENQGIAWYGVE